MISLIMTVLNEKSSLPSWFKSYKEQVRKADELVIVDGGSKDGTWEYLQEEKRNFTELKIIQRFGNISNGRNTAIAEAVGDFIVSTDAGCTYDKNWLAKIAEPLENKKGEWCATAFAPWIENGTILIVAIAASTIPAHCEFERDWLPSSRSVAFKKNLWQNVGGYPEWIPYCEDVLFDLKIQTIAGKPVFIREPLVFWQPRKNISAYFRQLYNYTRSEGHGKLNYWKQFVRYGTYLGVLAFILLSIIFSPIFVVPLVIGFFVYMTKYWHRWIEFTKQRNIFFKFSGYFIVPLVVAIGDVAKMAGFPVGIFERVSGKIKPNNL